MNDSHYHSPFHLSILHFPYRWTHTIHQMSLASHTSTLFHSSFNLLHVSPIKPHLHIHTTTHIPQQPPKPKHHITHLILQFFPASSLTYLNHFIPNFFQSQSKFTLVVSQASTIFHLSNFLLTLILVSNTLNSIQFFLGCIDFWNHILSQKNVFFVFIGLGFQFSIALNCAIHFLFRSRTISSCCASLNARRMSSSVCSCCDRAIWDSVSE